MAFNFDFKKLQEGLSFEQLGKLSKGVNLEGIQDGVEKAQEAVEPAIEEVKKYYEMYLEKTKQFQGLSQIVTGFVMMFFGGFFMTTIAVYEAINQSGGNQLTYNLNLLKEQAEKILEANEEDNLRDDDNDGIADVKQISDTQLGQRKFLLVLASSNPQIVSDALHGLYLILLATAATLQSQFARVISIGSSIGDVIEKSFAKFALPAIEEATPDEYKGWAKYAGIYACRLASVMIAFRIQRVLSTVHSSYKGAREFLDGLNTLAASQGRSDLTEGYLDEILSVVLFVAGVYLQLFFWSQLPGIIKIIAFPAFFVESILSTLVSPLLYAHKPPV